MADQLIRDIFDEYIFNELPTHLLYVPDMKLMGRSDVRKHFKYVLQEIEHELDGISGGDEQRRYASIRKLVKQKVKYAVLSHRWLDEGEPTFQEISRGESGDEPGYDKLMAFCEKAKLFGCDFVWSDTCCIDKTSSAELDEAIRSMFRWYRNAHMCIAYLADSCTIADFENEIWFRRGWTLQEVLAPWRMKFYGKGWIPFSGDDNDKGSEGAIMLAISRLTKIPMDDLISFSPGKDRVREKMSWASKRRTTRIEDVAYSLVGMFDVSLMVAYGEGRRAFYRLLEAIIQSSDDCDVFYWKGPRSPYSAALPASPCCYAPRGESTGHRASSIDSDSPRGALIKPGSAFSGTQWLLDAKLFASGGDKLFALTNHGLRLKVLLVRMNSDGTSESRSTESALSAEAGMRMRKVVFRHEDLEDVVVEDPIPYRDDMDINWAVGIIDYWQSYEKGCVDTRRGHPFTAFLLYNVGLPRRGHGPRGFFRGELEGERWGKVETNNIVEIRPKRFLEDALITLYVRESCRDI
ncbi:HET-domain-containing protein [Leucogyrophana mollusca]|uniref:HET-domain-containing protein n=1 Tax=Leucogyrophana mollusca TaxID=85980 RepID=A0ACB8BCW0_9AGAM|nr:HET-domain-containing protein [Leucogyrophana mollusca]